MSNNTKISEAISNISSTSKASHILVTGDGNAPGVDWVNCTSNSPPQHMDSIFLNGIRDSFLIQHVTEPTHHPPNCRANILDLVFTNEAGMVQGINHMSPLGKSHHQVLSFDFICNTDEDDVTEVMRPDYNNADIQGMKSVLKNYDWSILDGKNVDDAWSACSNKLSDLEKKFVPKKKNSKKKRRKPLWMNHSALRKVKLKHAAYMRYLDTKEGTDYSFFARLRNQAKWACRQAVVSFEKKLASEAKSNNKAFFAYVRSKLKTREGIGDLIDKNGNLASTNSDKAEVLNNYFSSVFTNEDLTNIPDPDPTGASECSTELLVTEEWTRKQLSETDPNKAPGLDGVHPRLLKELADELAIPFTKIYNASLSSGELPSVWKEAAVTPIFKKGKKAVPANYRPVSMTSIPCKILEKWVREVLVHHLQEHDLLSDHQHGFISKRSCTTNLLATIDEWTKNLDENMPTDCVYLDFSKAFDSVPHQRLAKKLDALGIRGQLLKWIQSFLADRKQCVRIGEATSTWAPVISGIPQGSVLGPILFVAFINDLPDCVNSSCEIFADDTKLFRGIKTESDVKILQEDLYKLSEWSKKWQLKFNADKCKVLHVGGSINNPKYYLNGQQLASSSEEKDLGVLVDDKLKFSPHIEAQVAKANRLLGLIRRAYTYMDKDIMKKLFSALVRPHLEYSAAVWRPKLKADQRKIEDVLRRATKLVPELKDLAYEERLRRMDMPSMRYRHERGDMIECWKFLHQAYNVSKPSLKLTSTSQDECPRVVTRNNGLKLDTSAKPPENPIRRHFFCHRVVKVWNSLPTNVVNAPSMNALKNRLDAFWIERKFRTPYGAFADYIIDE